MSSDDSCNKEEGNNKDLRHTLECKPNVPLWERVPSKDEYGDLLSDFMMFIPGLSRKSGPHQEKIMNRLQEVLSYYEKTVVFADLNLKINVLWVSVRPVKGICIELPAAIRVAVPEAVLVSSKYG